jgi:hypothetical protein
MPTTTILDVETSARFDIDNIHEGLSWTTLVFNRWTNSKKTTPENYPAGDYTMEVFKNSRYEGEPAMLIEQGAGLEITGAVLTVTRTATENTLKPHRYYYRILCEVDADNIHQIIHGVLNVDY